MTDILRFDSWERSGRENAGMGSKISIVQDGKIYIVKFPKRIEDDEKIQNMNSSYSNDISAEHMGCQIFQSIGIDTQKTHLGLFVYDGIEEKVVACEDFTGNGFLLQEFNRLANSALVTDSIGKNPDLEKTLTIINTHPKFDTVREEAISRFWDTFIVDSFISNFDRHAGNWGYLYNEQTKEIKLAPVYDCGSSLYPRLNDEGAAMVLEKKDLMLQRVYSIPKSSLSLNGKRINYYDYISSHANKDCDEALKRVYSKLNMDAVHRIVNNTEFESPIRKDFLNTLLDMKYERIIEHCMKPLINREKQTRNNSVMEVAKQESKNHVSNGISRTNSELER